MYFATPHVSAGPWSTRMPLQTARYCGWPPNPVTTPVQRSCLATPRSGNTSRSTAKRVAFALPPRRHDSDTSTRSRSSIRHVSPFSTTEKPWTGSHISIYDHETILTACLLGVPTEPDTGMSRLFQAQADRRHNSPHGATHHPATGPFKPLYGEFQTRTDDRHNKENGCPRFPPVRQTSNLPPDISFNETHFQASPLTPHPFLAPPSLQLVYDLRLLPATVSFPPISPYNHCGYQQLAVPMHAGNPRRVRLVSPDFPWSFDLDFSSQGSVNGGHPRTNAGIDGRARRGPEQRTITCLDLLTSLHVALQQPLADVEWGSADDRRRASILRACDRRLRLAQYTRERPSQTQTTERSSSPRSRPSFNSGFSSSTIRLTKARNHSVLRVDWLGSKVLFGGLVRDDDFAHRRLFPGTEGPPETWVVKFRKL
ncbi:hypothetical protein BS17DRAFT_440895 [Gyrodon lividus]|nr:hypothetical protein BS17DRAFT_440895 [Gyrodon lividus]